MTRRAFFSDAVLADLLAGRRCPQCGQLDAPLAVLYPEVSEHNNVIELKFHTRCGCGSAATFRLKLPVLMLGFVLAREELRRAAARPAAPYVPPQVRPSRSKLFEELANGYTDLVRALPGRSLAPTPADQAALGLGDPDWRDFLKRMELRPDGGEETNP